MSQIPGSIVCVHPNHELYGSDRVFLAAVAAFKKRWPCTPITVLISRLGQLSEAMTALDVEIRQVPMVVLRRANLMGTARSVLGLLWATARARKMLSRHDLVYISTVTPLDYLFATRWISGSVLIHVHELPTGKTRALISGILRLTRGFLVFISQAVRDAFPDLATRRGAVVWNGVRPFSPVSRKLSDTVHMLLIGRFNAWKGQDFFIEAVSRIPVEHRRNLEIKLVGGAFAGQEHFEETAASLIQSHGLQNCITIHGFEPDPERFFRWADVVVVPSTRPEPFGLVAIEAMAAGCATIAADHGGLSEIVVDGETGILVPPNDPERLADALCRYLNDPALAVTHGAAGLARYQKEFRQELFMERIADVASDQLERRSPAIRSSEEGNLEHPS